ncbi:MAG: glutamate-5-semialdehyde dehydrogenase [Xylanivirga thermophila]|jgi:glutamate-5-semialdehyde dehydrogenase|uniref:glutamate-5-semialdehyde dehydrogenase n=1 Tax=Xylanivirga thermophila TaxID=2496273 RepID=UPI00101B8A70|nr:glutamate-5-semialdehyde dehydrogenase [Xylanivirga thermophila]
MESLIVKGEQAKRGSRVLGNLSSNVKDNAIKAMANALLGDMNHVLEANKKDVEMAKQKGRAEALVDRLQLNEERLNDMAEGLRQIVSLPDPIGEVVSMWKRPNGLMIGQRRVPLGVIGIIYEARPNVTADAVGLCIKSGNAVILKGGSEAINSNKAIIDVLTRAAYDNGIPRGSIQLIEDTDRETTKKFMRLNDYIDALIPRGGAGLIKTVVEESTIPVIQTGVGNCHIYVHSAASFDMASDIIVNAKAQRPGVCNAAEKLLVDRDVANIFLPQIVDRLKHEGVRIKGCAKTMEIVPQVEPANEEDWYTEYLDYIMSIKVVDDIYDAVEHINKYGTGHSEAIVTNDYSAANYFLDMVDAAAVYVNASTRFTDGFQFGFGAEIGISTQKLHARGPMGLKELTTTKYVIYGNGQIRQ